MSMNTDYKYKVINADNLVVAETDCKVSAYRLALFVMMIYMANGQNGCKPRVLRRSHGNEYYEVEPALSPYQRPLSPLSRQGCSHV